MPRGTYAKRWKIFRRRRNPRSFESGACKVVRDGRGGGGADLALQFQPISSSRWLRSRASRRLAGDGKGISLRADSLAHDMVVRRFVGTPRWYRGAGPAYKDDAGSRPRAYGE